MREMGSLPLLPFELDVADVGPPIPELRASLLRSPDSLPYCRRGVNLFVCSMMLGLYGVVPAPLLMGIVGDPGVPKLRRVGVVGCTAPAIAVPPASVAAIVSRLGACAPLPLGDSSALVGCNAAASASSIVSSSWWILTGMSMSSYWSI